MKKINLINGVFLGLITICFVLTISAFTNKAEISEKENRTLQVFPTFTIRSYLNGSFFKELESYFYDHFPKRDQVLGLVTMYDKVKGIQPKVMALEKGNMNMVNDNAQSKNDKKQDTPGSFKGMDFAEYKTQTQNLSIMAVDDKLMELYHFDENKIDRYTKALNQFASQMPEGIRMYSLLAPTQVGLTDQEYKDFNDPQDKAINFAYSLLKKRYQSVPVFDTLYNHREEYIYFRSDHHWTPLGAYYGAKQFSQTAEVPFVDIDQYEKHSFAGFLGYLYNNNQVEKVAEHPDRIDAYILPSRTMDLKLYTYQDNGSLTSFAGVLTNLNMDPNHVNYGIFLGGDYPIAIYENPEVKNNRNLIIVKDSYANAFIPWIASSFDKIVVIDPRFFKENIYELAKQEGITDFLVLDYVMAIGLDGYIDFLEQLANPQKKLVKNKI